MNNENNNLNSNDQRLVYFGEFRFDRDNLELYRAGKRVALPERAASVLNLLIDNHGALVSRDKIRTTIWGERHVDFEASLNTAVRSIRRALGDEAGAPHYIETSPRRGYRFLPTPQFGAAQNSRPPAKLFAGGLALVTTLMFFAFAFYRQPAQDQFAKHYINSPGYENFLRGRHALSKGRFNDAEARLNEAIAQDPELAPALESLARINMVQRRHGWEKIIKAQNYVDRALVIDPRLASAQALKAGIALYYWRDTKTARNAAETALKIAPNAPDAYGVLAYLNIIEDDQKSALQAIARAHEIQPLSSSLNADYGWIHYKAGNWNDAERLCKTSIELNPKSQFALNCVIHVNHSQGDAAEAVDYGVQLMALRGAKKEEIARLRQIPNAKTREKEYWLWTLSWIDANRAEITDSMSKRGIALTMLGRYDDAAETFADAYEINGEPFLSFFAVDPRVEELRGHVKFAALAEHSRTPVTLKSIEP